MTKSEFRKHIVFSSLLTAVAVVAILSFCVILFHMYPKPTEENTAISSGTVAHVYYSSNIKEVIVEMSDGEQLQLVCPWLPADLYDAIGYDLDQLARLLEGQEVEYRRMDKLPWVVEIYVHGVVIDNHQMTSAEIDSTYIGITVIGLMMLAFPICGEAVYIKTKYKLYKRAEKKRSGSDKRKEDRARNG